MIEQLIWDNLDSFICFDLALFKVLDWWSSGASCSVTICSLASSSPYPHFTLLPLLLAPPHILLEPHKAHFNSSLIHKGHNSTDRPWGETRAVKACCGHAYFHFQPKTLPIWWCHPRWVGDTIWDVLMRSWTLWYQPMQSGMLWRSPQSFDIKKILIIPF